MSKTNIAFAALTVLFCMYAVTAAFWSRSGSICTKHNERAQWRDAP
jgi:hypothetical protein